MSGVDVLADALRMRGARGSLGVRLEAGGCWGARVDALPLASLYLVTEGQVWLGTSGSALRIDAGCAVHVPERVPHVLVSEPGALAERCDLDAACAAMASGAVLRLGDGPVRARLITAYYELGDSLFPDAFPVLVTAEERPQLAATAALLAAELAEPQFGTTAAVNSIVDLLLVQFARAWLAANPVARSRSWLGALLDPLVREALTRMHGEPARAWTTANLASALNVSRATLSRRFPLALGEPPGAYLTRLRMDLAAIRLRDTDEPLESVAEAVGYGSGKAFSRAFQRSRGRSPSDYRFRARHRGRAAVVAGQGIPDLPIVELPLPDPPGAALARDVS
ncbi:AraC family transcriptional regulator [Actinosynnema mirum]|uniref:Transcriptional regulator, AraC family n=2 Tax=Actinosynnema TaxID=40566 RepID=C6WK58_ACTMD|nr:AraC family transcriptional regulator [Actinosynnema mirum]ACU38271.1 transcriptional regulator, AraC family [Actinosynnema mirum DSM 43827]AXX31788.1 putative transcriptional regulator, AraC family [Actinosynnema pretiosum subsp. pretiosum]